MISNTPTDIKFSVIITGFVVTYNCDFEQENLATFEPQEWWFLSHLVTLSKLLTKVSAKVKWFDIFTGKSIKLTLDSNFQLNFVEFDTNLVEFGEIWSLELHKEVYCSLDKIQKFRGLTSTLCFEKRQTGAYHAMEFKTSSFLENHMLVYIVTFWKKIPYF